jgi:hypothetical protein
MCNCGRVTETTHPRLHLPQEEQDFISGKWILDTNKRRLYVQSPIRDFSGSIIGYITNNEEGSIFRIFSKNVYKVFQDE